MLGMHVAIEHYIFPVFFRRYLEWDSPNPKDLIVHRCTASLLSLFHCQTLAFIVAFILTGQHPPLTTFIMET